MNIVAHVHAYPPAHNAGAEWMLHTMLRGLVNIGHSAHVLTDFNITNSDKPRYQNVATHYDFEGVKVYRYGTHARNVFSIADLVITHLEKGNDSYHGAPRWAMENGVPLARLVHNSVELITWKATNENTDLLIFNSEWLRKSYNERLTNGWNQIVFAPPIDADYYKTSRESAEYITLINLNDNKGAIQFYSIASMMPDKKFLGVKGSYDFQMVRNLPNVTILDNTPDIKSVYQKTKILLVPSAIETYGRVAVEAMCSGIPVIYNPTEGLREACGMAGIPVNRTDINGYVEAIKKLDDPAYYEQMSKSSYIRADKLKPDYKYLEAAFLKTIGQYSPSKKEMIQFTKGVKVPSGNVKQAIAKRNFRHKEISYVKGEVSVPVEDYDFLVNRGLIEGQKAVEPKIRSKADKTLYDNKAEKKTKEDKETKKIGFYYEYGNGLND